jgi:hypothetical protein
MHDASHLYENTQLIKIHSLTISLVEEICDDILSLARSPLYNNHIIPFILIVAPRGHTGPTRLLAAATRQLVGVGT